MIQLTYATVREFPDRFQKIKDYTKLIVSNTDYTSHAQDAAGAIRMILAAATIAHNDAGPGAFIGAILLASRIIEDAAGNPGLPLDAREVYIHATDILEGR